MRCITAGHFTFWTSLSLGPKTETKRLILVSAGVEINQSPQRIIAQPRWRHRRLIADFAVFLLFILNQRKSEVIFAHQNLISNWLTYLAHAKSTGELISFGFSDRSVRSLVSANDFTFWLKWANLVKPENKTDFSQTHSAKKIYYLTPTLRVVITDNGSRLRTFSRTLTG